MIGERENWLRAVEFRGPAWVPCGVSIAPVLWRKHRESLERIVLAHPRIFPDFTEGGMDFDKYPAAYEKGERFRDEWGCVWYNAVGGIEGQVVESPLEDWAALESYRPPDPRTTAERGPRDWPEIRRLNAERYGRGKLRWGDGERLFDRLYFLRGFENLMMDIAAGDSRLPRLIGMLRDHAMENLRLFLDAGVDVVGFHTDIGTQNSLMISPAAFRRHIKPLFAELFGACRAAGAHAYLSSDGRLLEIVDDLVECGVSVHDPQLRANGLDGIVRCYKGRLCANIDLDRQAFAFIGPAAVRDMVKECLDRMYDPRGGLMLLASFWDGDTPLANIEAACAAFEDFCFPAGTGPTRD
jgi:uroporphyrinogen decarboxylase